ncbi:MAG: hypothetical protein JW955_01360 [Sedimentisphaerales bacterium]|nr:hypothetical protein [Sedimentisphaerales bacterium]
MLHARSIAVSSAVICIFAVAIIGSIGGLSPWSCCERALLAAVVVYLAAGVAVRAINTILIQAIADRQVGKERGSEGQS